MRIRGRTIRPSTLAERRLMLALGVPFIRVPRGSNPYVVGRRFSRAARCQTPDHLFLREVVDRTKSWPVPEPSPEPDVSEPASEEATSEEATRGRVAS